MSRDNTLAARLAGNRPERAHWSEVWMPKLIECIESIKQAVAPSRYSDKWQPQTHALPTGRSAHIVKRNPARLRCLLITDANNNSAVWIGSAPFNGIDPPQPRDGYAPIAADSNPIELLHRGDIYAWSSTNGNVITIEEYGV